jgi:hypothetical protein
MRYFRGGNLMVKSSSSQVMPVEPRRRTPTQVPRVPPARPGWQPIDFDGEDTSLTQDHLALLK